MILRQFLHTDPVVAVSYLFGCGGKGMGGVVDPVAPPEFYLRAAEAAGLPIRYVVDTHIHADHLSTGPALAAVAGAEYLLHESADVVIRHRDISDGERLELANVVAEAWHVPGHTPEHVALVVTDRTRASEPWLVFTGHTLMVGDMGRTELATTAEDGARALFDSASRLRTLQDHVLVMPGAFSGSVCGRGLSGVPLTTIGFERSHNRAFALTERGAFVDLMLRDVPPRPLHAEVVRRANQGYADPASIQGLTAVGA